MSSRTVYRDDALYLPDRPSMKFRLTCEGPLRPSQRSAVAGQPVPLAPHKMEVRRAFHRQLRDFWKWHKRLAGYTAYPTDWNVDGTKIPGEAYDHRGKVPFVEVVRLRHQYAGYQWVPLACEDYGVTVGLDILFLRRDGVGSVLEIGDLDNRVKTLIDCLKKPRNPNEIAPQDATPRADETPFYCLMEDDSLVSRLTVESDQLFAPPQNARSTSEEIDADDRHSHVIVTVDIQDVNGTFFSSIFG